MNKILAGIGTVIIAMGIFFIGQGVAIQNLGEATSGLASEGRIATTTEVGPDLNTQVFAKNVQCTSRIVSTQAQAIMLTFFDPSDGDVSSTTLSQTVGHIQGASTTEVYNSGVYGCGRVFGYAAASTTITGVEMR